MFVIQKDKKIILTKGDTASMNIEVIDLDGNKYLIEEDDTIKLTVRKTSESPVSIEKIAENNIIIFRPEDTNELKTGLYVYDVQLKTKEGNIYTIVPMSFFELKSEVTYG